MVQNKGVIFKAVPKGYPQKGKDLAVESREIDLSSACPKGGIIVKNSVVSFDPYLRGRMRPAEVKSYSPAFTINEPIANTGITKVVKSDNANFKEGDILKGHTGIEEYTVVPADYCAGFEKIQNPHNLPLSYFLGALGMPGLTAYSSFYEIGKPKKGETIFVSAASGAVGSIVGQLAKREGLRVIGSVGSDEKVAFVKNELGFDEAFNYKTESPAAALKKYAPNGIDIYYDNVGGETLDAVLENANDFGRLIECGMISQYNIADRDSQYGVKNLMHVVAKRLTMRGFIVSDPDMEGKYAKEHQENVAKWLANNEMVYLEDTTEGIDNAVDGFIGLLHGKNFGKATVKIADIYNEGAASKL